MKSISFTKGEIKKLIYKNVVGSSIIRRGERKPTYMKFFEQGLKEKFFGERGIVTNQHIELQRYFLLEKLKRDNQLKQQINIGELTYLLLKNNDNLQQKRIDNYKQGHLERSKLFTYNTKHSSIHLKQSSSDIKHTYTHTHNNSTDNKAYTKLTIKRIQPSSLNANQSNEKNIQFQSRNKTNNKIAKRIITYSGIGTSPPNHINKHLNISISPFHYADTINVNSNNNSNYNHTIVNSKHDNDIFPPSLHVDNMNTIVPHTERVSIIDNKSSLLNLRKTKTNIKHNTSNSFNNSKKRKLFIETFFKKATLVQSKQTKMDKALYKIMSKSKQAMKNNKKQIPLVLKKDIEIIIGKRIKRRKKCESLEIPNDGKYGYMGKKKAEMLEISDNIMHMRDNTLKEFGNQIQLSYWKKSDGNESNNPIESKYIKEEVERKKMLNKLNCGLELMHKLSYKMLHKKNQVIDG